MYSPFFLKGECRVTMYDDSYDDLIKDFSHVSLRKKPSESLHIKTSETPKKYPAAYWYDQDKTCDILDPDGWDRSESSHPSYVWNYVLISKEQYDRRRRVCTVAPYMTIKHRHPFA